MATKSANVLARVAPEVKRQAEEILASLGVSASTTINMLYKQIILTRSIPFPIALPAAPMARDEMDDETFHAVMQKGMDEVKAGLGLPLEEAFAQLLEGIE